jgi:hypothetical protein
MKKALTLTATLSVFISIQPVSAVDYVACREMLRTKNEMLNDGGEQEADFWNILLERSCPKLSFTNKKYIPNTTILVDSIDIENELICRDKAETLYKKKLKPLLQIKNGILLPGRFNPHYSFYNPSAIGLIKSGIKVMRDMKKAGCPYE